MVMAGAIWMPVLPDMSKFNTTLRAGMSVTGVAARGRETGESYSSAMLRAVRTGMSPLSAEVGAQARAASEAAALAAAKAATQQKAAAEKVVLANDKVTAAVKRQQAALTNVRLAQEKLALAQKNASGVASERQAIALTQAEARLEAAEAGAASATGTLSAAQRRQVAAADAAKVASDRLAIAEERAGAIAASAGAETAVAGSRFGGMAAGAERAGSKLGGFIKTAGGMAGLFGAFELAKFGGESVKAATEFQKSTSVLVTAAGETKSNLVIIRKGIVDISNDTGTATDQLSEGMYTIEKAGIRGANGLKVLDAAAKGAKEENADLGVVTNAMTSIMNSYGVGAGKSVQVMNELKTAAAASKTSMQNFAGSLSTVLPIAAANKISFADVAGAIGTLTSHGTSAQEATQELAFSIRSLSAPNAVAIKEMGQFGISSQDVATHLGKKGLQGTIEQLSQAVLTKMGPSGKVLLNTFYTSTSAAKSAAQMYDSLTPASKKLADAFKTGSMSYKDWLKEAKGSLAPEQYNQINQWATLQKKATGFNDAIKQGLPGSQTYSEAMKKMMGGATGLNTALMLTGTSAEATKKRTDEISKSYMNNATEVEGWSATQQTAAVAQDRMKNSLKNAGMVMATAFLPSLTKMTTGMADGITNLMKWGSQNWSWLGPTAKILGVMGGALLTFSIIKSITTWIKGWTIVQALLNTETGVFTALWEANPLGVIVLGVAALVAGLVLAYQKVGWFRNAVNAAFSGIKVAISAVTGWWKRDAWPSLEGGFNAIVSAGKSMWHGLEAAWSGLKSGISAVGNAAMWLYRSAILPAFNGAKSAISAVGNSAIWLYKTAIKPTFDFIAAAGQWLWGYILGPIFALWLAEWKLIGSGLKLLWTGAIQPLFQKIGDFGHWLWYQRLKPAFDQIVSGFRTIGHWADWLWNNVIQPSWQKMGDFGRWLWKVALKPALDGISSGMHTVGNWASWLWNSAIKPAWNAIGTGVRNDYNAYIKPVLSGFQNAMQTVGHWASWLWNSGIKPAWNSIGSGMHSVYTSTIHPVISAFQTVMHNLGSAVSSVVSGIGRAWGGLTSALSHPVNVVIGFIDDHFIKGFNNIMSAVPGVKLRLPMIPKISTGGSSNLSHVPVGHVAPSRGMAGGGILPGASSWHHGDDQLVPMRRGEGVIVSEALRDRKSKALVYAINHAALRGGASLSAMFGGEGGFSVGGIIGNLWDGIKDAAGAAKAAASFVANPASAIRGLLNGIGDSWPAQVAMGGIRSIASDIGNAIKGAVGLGGGGDGGSLPLGAKGSGKPGSGWQWMWNTIHSHFPGAMLTSAYRPGAIVAGSGQQSMHATGRAIDIGGSVPMLKTIARWIAANYGAGPMTQLLYTPAFGNMGIYNGRWYPQPSVTVAEHGNHVHWGYARGGVVGGDRSAPVFDHGGTLAPGLNVVDNRLGRPEHLVRADEHGMSDADVQRIADAVMAGSYQGTYHGTAQHDANMAMAASMSNRATARSGGVLA